MPDRPDPTLLRLCCDDELLPEQAAQWEQYLQSHPQDAEAITSQLAAERQLRQRVCDVMKACPCAPASLAANIRAVFASMDVDAPVDAAPEIAGRIDETSASPASATSHGSQRSSEARLLFAEPHRVNYLAIAATLALVAGAVLFGIFGRTIDDVAPTAPGDLISDAATFADSEHGLCTRGASQLAKKVELLTSADAELFLSEYLGTQVNVFDLKAAGYEFIGAGQCDMPVPARSGHLIYKKITEPGQPAPMLSVFLVRDQGRCKGKLCEGIDKGKWGCVTDRGIKCKHTVMRGTDGKLVYFVVCCDDRDIQGVTQQMQLASSSPSYR